MGAATSGRLRPVPACAQHSENAGSPTLTELRDRFDALSAALRARFIERDALVEAALAALVAGQHLLIIGPPGTAKSQLAEALRAALEGAVGFSWLLTRFTTPEELFGPISLRGLEQDRYTRITDGKLPRAHVVFLDEVFKANSAILNALLTVMNERRFHDGPSAQPIPLRTLVGASNELPDEDELLALYDRFLVRVVVDFIDEDFRFVKLLTMEDAPPLPTITLAQLDAARAAAAALPVDAQVLRDLPALRRDLRERGVTASDRRWKQSLGYLRAAAWLAGREAVDEADLPLLRHVLWSAPEEREEVEAALDALLSGEQTEVRALLFQARELAGYPDRFDRDDLRARAALEVYTKLGLLRDEAKGHQKAARGRGRALAAIEAAIDEIEGLRAQVQRHLTKPLQ